MTEISLIVTLKKPIQQQQHYLLVFIFQHHIQFTLPDIGLQGFPSPRKSMWNSWKGQHFIRTRQEYEIHL